MNQVDLAEADKLLDAMRAGNAEARDQLLETIYLELKRLARHSVPQGSVAFIGLAESTHDRLAVSTTQSSLAVEIQEFFPDPALWLNSPNDQLGGRRPNDLIGTPDEFLVRDLLNSIKYIGIS